MTVSIQRRRPSLPSATLVLDPVRRRAHLANLVLSTIAAITLLSLVSCSGGESHAATDETAVPVRVQVLQAVTEPGRTTVAGELVAANRIDVASRLAGRVTALAVSEGSRVEKGEVLARIDSPEITAALSQSKATEAVAQSAFDVASRQAERMARLAEREVVTPRDRELADLGRDEAEANLAGARAARRMAEQNMAYSVLRAPRSGVVVDRFVREGDLAVPGKPLVILEDDGPREVRITLPAALDWDVKAGLRADVRLPAINSAVEAVIDRVSPSAGGHTQEAFLTLDAAVDQPTGTFVQVDIATGSSAESLRLPPESLYTRGALTGVFLVVDDRAVLRWVRLAEDGRVLAGVAVGDTVVVSPSSDLADGAAVEVGS